MRLYYLHDLVTVTHVNYCMRMASATDQVDCTVVWPDWVYGNTGSKWRIKVL